MNRLWLLGIALAFVLATEALAGSGPASLTCKSRSTPTLTLKGVIPRDEELLDLKLTRGKTTRPIQGFVNAATGRLEDKGARGYVIEDFRHQVFAMWIVTRAGEPATLRLHAIPSSVKATITAKQTRASFQALLTTPKPEHVGSAMAGDMIWDMPMSCTYSYGPV